MADDWVEHLDDNPPRWDRPGSDGPRYIQFIGGRYSLIDGPTSITFDSLAEAKEYAETTAPYQA